MAHKFTVRVYYEDTDMGGIVYHANYLRFIERARSDWVRGPWHQDQARAEEKTKVWSLPCAGSKPTILAPAKFDDELD